jgi:exonuclease VII large subunit
MSVAVDQFCDKLRDRLNAIEARLKTVKTDIQDRSEAAETALRGKLDEIRTKLKDQGGRMDQMRSELKARAQQKIAETKEAISDWKVKQETRKLKARAERAQAYAADAMEYALATIDEAEEAILDAMLARMDTERSEKPAAVH